MLRWIDTSSHMVFVITLWTFLVGPVACAHGSFPHIPILYNHPGWVHRLPEHPTASGIPLSRLEGNWERTVRNRFSVASKIAKSSGIQRIIIGREGEGTYVKLHDYVEVVQGERTIFSYRETGHVASSGPWVLFTPEQTMVFESETERVDLPGGGIRNEDLIIPVIDAASYEKMDLPAPLLFYLDARRSMLVPLLYDRHGSVFSYGLVEGATEPYNDSSQVFQAILRKYTEQEFRSHGYRLTSGIPWQE